VFRHFSRPQPLVKQGTLTGKCSSNHRHMRCDEEKHILGGVYFLWLDTPNELLLHYELEQCLLVISSNFQRSATVRGRDASSEKPRRNKRRWYSKRREARRGSTGRRQRAGKWRPADERQRIGRKEKKRGTTGWSRGEPSETRQPVHQRLGFCIGRGHA
jgi:hypothetical protein